MGGNLSRAVAAVRGAARPVLAQLAGEHPGSTVVVALSGGADSLALAAAVAFEAPKLGLRGCAVTIDHGLQDGSQEVAQRAAAQAVELGLSAQVRRVEVVTTADGPEADARTARYAALQAAAQEVGAVAILTAHTRDDQAEQVLLGLSRGSGLRSLAGIRARRENIRRPLLSITRQQTEAACRAEGLEFWSDPHNEDVRYKRVLVRKKVLPELERELGPGVAAALARTAQQLQEDAAALDAFAAWVQQTLEQDGAFVRDAGSIQLPIGPLVCHPRAIQKRVVRAYALEVAWIALSAHHTDEVMRLIENWHGQSELHLPGLRVWREKRRLFMRANPIR